MIMLSEDRGMTCTPTTSGTTFYNDNDDLGLPPEASLDRLACRLRGLVEQLRAEAKTRPSDIIAELRQLAQLADEAALQLADGDGLGGAGRGSVDDVVETEGCGITVRDLRLLLQPQVGDIEAAGFCPPDTNGSVSWWAIPRSGPARTGTIRVRLEVRGEKLAVSAELEIDGTTERPALDAGTARRVAMRYIQAASIEEEQAAAEDASQAYLVSLYQGQADDPERMDLIESA